MSKTNYTQGKGGVQHSTDPRYLDWIHEYEQRKINNPNLAGEWSVQAIFRGSCLNGSKEMQQAFPELKLVRGTAVSIAYLDRNEDLQDLINPEDGHVWLETDDGLIVDPTRKQFYSPANLYYIAFDESRAKTLPTGKCPNCGGFCYNGQELCSEKCFRAYEAYLNSESW